MKGCLLLVPLCMGMLLGLGVFYLMFERSSLPTDRIAGTSELHTATVLESTLSWQQLGMATVLTKCKERPAQVCSHRGHLSKNTAVHLHQAFYSLRSLGVACVDLDVFATSDGFLLVGRETDIVGSNRSREDLETMTLSEITKLQKFPSVTEVLSHFKSIFVNGKRKLMQPARHTPLIFMELKGKAFSENSMAFVHQQAVGAGVGDALYLWAANKEQVSLASAIAPRLGVKVGISVPDRDPNALAWVMPAIKSGVFMLSAPSIHLKPSAHATLIESSIKRAMWVIDRQEDLDHAIDLKADIIITNEPGETMTKLIAMKC
jgi:glycerophosphoryl diester phosphodiesterase